jgi:hypothetical protein
MENDNVAVSLEVGQVETIQTALHHYALSLRAAGIPGIANSVDELRASFERKTVRLIPLEKGKHTKESPMLPVNNRIVSGLLKAGQVETIQTALYHYELRQRTVGALDIANSVEEIRTLLSRKTMSLTPVDEGHSLVSMMMEGMNEV